jgi:hypothetical protein
MALIMQNSALAISGQPDFLPTTARVLCESPHLRRFWVVFYVSGLLCLIWPEESLCLPVQKCICGKNKTAP